MKPKKSPLAASRVKAAAPRRGSVAPPLSKGSATGKAASGVRAKVSAPARKKAGPVAARTPKVTKAAAAAFKKAKTWLPSNLTTPPQVPANLRTAKPAPKKKPTSALKRPVAKKTLAPAKPIQSPKPKASPAAPAPLPSVPPISEKKAAAGTKLKPGKKAAKAIPAANFVESPEIGTKPAGIKRPVKIEPSAAPAKKKASIRKSRAKAAEAAVDAPSEKLPNPPLVSVEKALNAALEKNPVEVPRAKGMARAKGVPAKPARLKQLQKAKRTRPVSADLVVPPATDAVRAALEPQLPAGTEKILRAPALKTSKEPAKPTLESAVSRESISALPPILFEGDEPLPQKQCVPEEGEDLPESAGAGHLLLVARDPSSFYAAWDLPAAVQEKANKESAHGHMVLLVWEGSIGKRVVSEIALHKESRHWFVHTPAQGAAYACELGYYDSARRWVSLVTSDPVQTPGPALAGPSGPVRFTTIISQPSMPQFAPVGAPSGPQETHTAPQSAQTQTPLKADVPATCGSPPLTAALAQDVSAGRQQSHVEPPPQVPAGAALNSQQPAPASPQPPAEGMWSVPRIVHVIEPTPGPKVWTREMEEVIQRLSRSVDQPTTPASQELAGLEELIRKSVRVESETSSLSLALSQAEAGPGPVAAPVQTLPSSIEAAAPRPAAAQPQSSFWLKVNTELVIYGSTDPYAKVTIGGRPIQLRKDGTFSFRFSLPNGAYSLPVKAVSMDGDTRAAKLSFARDTKYSGEVGVHPQDPSLHPPKPENVT